MNYTDPPKEIFSLTSYHWINTELTPVEEEKEVGVNLDMWLLKMIKKDYLRWLRQINN